MILTKENVKKLNENSLCQEILIPLLNAMGFRDVYFYHGGPGELGKDIVCWKEDELGSRRNYALVVKAVKVTGKAKIEKGSAGEIAMQIQQCFGSDYLDPITSEPEIVHYCWIVSNKKIGKEAETAIRSSLKAVSLDRNIQYIDEDNLWKLIEKHLPRETVINKLLDVGKTISNLDSHYQPKITLINDSQINFEIMEKYPGASIEKPLIIKPSFQFPETIEGIAAKEAFIRSFETGEPSDTPLQFLKSIELPEIIGRLINHDDLKNGVFHIGGVVDQIHKTYKLQVICDDGEIAEIENVELYKKWQGTKKITLENREQNKIFDLIFEFNLEEKKVTFSLKTNNAETRNPHQLLQRTLFLYCLGKPNTVNIIDQETGLLFISKKTEGLGDPIPEIELDYFKDLELIQKRIQFPIIIPMRPMPDEEKKTIGYLRSILHFPKRTGNWDKLESQVNNEGLKKIFELINNNERVQLRNIFNEEVELFGKNIPIGKVQITYANAKVVNLDEIKNKSTHLLSDESVTVVFAPAGENSSTIEYLDWQL